MRSYRAGVVIVVAAIAFSIVAEVRTARSAPTIDDPGPPVSASPILSGREGELIRYGRLLINETPKFAGRYITAQMSCSACHINAGTKPRGGSLLGVYAKFPQWNRRANRFITLGDRLEECFLYSMNGYPPAPYSREIVAM